MKFKPYHARSLERIPQIQNLGARWLTTMQVVARVLPFRTNNYVVEQLIDWSKVPDDPVFQLTFPQRGMLESHYFQRIELLMRSDAPEWQLRSAARRIRAELNPHPAGQLDQNTARLDGQCVDGLQHKYRETLLLFPAEGQTCHGYCTYCFRWAQFIGDDSVRMACGDPQAAVRYLRAHPEITDVLITGGDPMVMRTRVLARYVDAILTADLPNVRHIRFGTKALAFWPYRFTTDGDADDLMRLFERVIASGRHVALMAHFSHAVELSTEAQRKAAQRLRNVGCEIRCQAPLVAHVNDSADIWVEMVQAQLCQGMVPYYLFLVRDTGAQHYFGVPLARALKIYRDAASRLSGLGRTMRGPSMSATPGKIEVLGVDEIGGEKVFCLRFLQARKPEWVGRLFHAKYNPKALWIDDLEPAFDAPHFFFEHEEELQDIDGAEQGEGSHTHDVSN